MTHLASPAPSPNDYSDPMLFRKNYFDAVELERLRELFPQKRLHAKDIYDYLPELQNFPKLLYSMMRIISRKHGDHKHYDLLDHALLIHNLDETVTISVNDWISFLSVISYGAHDEHVPSQSASTLLSSYHHPRPHECSEDAQHIVDDIYHLTKIHNSEKPEKENKLLNTGVSYITMTLRAKSHPDISRCFGFFDYIHDKVLYDIESKFEPRPSRVGGLLMKSGLFWNPVRVETRDGFLIIQDNEDNEYLKSFSLLHVTVFTTVDAHIKILQVKGSITLRAAYLGDAARWVHIMRANARDGHRYGSFAPMREGITCEWFVNGRSYFEAVMAAIPQATREIFIAGWWVAPALYLSRAEELDPNWMLGHLLASRAEQGVKVYVLIWNETNWGYNLGSSQTKSWLEKQSKNIKVLRHPTLLPVRWSHHQKLVVLDQSIAFLGGIDLCFFRYEDKHFRLTDPEGVVFPGIDYANLTLGVDRTANPQICELDRETQPRMPWHDVAVCVEGEAAFDTTINFIQRWNHAVESLFFRGNYNLLVPYTSYPESIASVPPPHEYQMKNEPPQPPSRRFSVYQGHRRMSLPPPRKKSMVGGQALRCSGGLIHSEDLHVRHKYFGLRCQIVRSVSGWSSGQPTERSYYRAILDIIRGAEHYIYIQNQYMISSTSDHTPRNKIADAIADRIGRAIEEGKVFRVFVVLPVYQAEQFQLLYNKAIIKWTAKALYRDRKSVFAKLRDKYPGVDLNQYLSVFALRNWELSNNNVFTEQVYVHSKLVIVDDKRVVIGSGNFNDRSMLGTRDSELGIIITDLTNTVDISMNGHPFRAGEFARSLRTYLWNIHLGVFQVHQQLDPGCHSHCSEAGGRHGPAHAHSDPSLPASNSPPSMRFPPHCNQLPFPVRICDSTKAENDRIHDLISDPICQETYDLWRGIAAKNTEIYKEIFGKLIPENCKVASELKKDILRNVDQATLDQLKKIRGYIVEFPQHMLEDEKSLMLTILTSRLKLNIIL